jgi:energy-coupling factor transporter ATP-binding protein EcfA2
MSSELDEDCESRCMVQALQVSFGYPGRAVAQEASHCWHAGLCLLQGDEGTGKTSWLKALAGQLPLRTGLLHYPFADNGRLAASSCFWQDPRQPLNDVYSHMPAQSWVALQRTLYPHWSQQQFEQHVQAGLEPHLPLLACRRAPSASCGWPPAGPAPPSWY